MSANKKKTSLLHRISCFLMVHSDQCFFPMLSEEFKSRDNTAIPCTSIWFKSVFLPDLSYGFLCGHLQPRKSKTAFRYPDFPGCISIPVRHANILPLTLGRREGFPARLGTGDVACRTAPNPPEAATEIFRGSPSSHGLLLILLVITALPIKTLPPEPGIDQSNPAACQPYR